MKNFTDLQVWREARLLRIIVRKLTDVLPEEEKFVLVAQMRRSALSVTSNIAEGSSRFSYRDRIRFYYNSRGSLSEIEDCLTDCLDNEYINKEAFKKYIKQTQNVKKLLNGLIRSSKRLSEH